MKIARVRIDVASEVSRVRLDALKASRVRLDGWKHPSVRLDILKPQGQARGLLALRGVQ